MERHRIGIVIPALNEAATICSVVANASIYGTSIVVDDGSSDGTGALATAAGAVVVRHDANRGYDKALDSGFKRADEMDCLYVITMDADGQHDPTILSAFIKALDSGADVVIGTRDRLQRMSEHLFAWVGKLAWGVDDPLCGMKAYRVEVYREMGYFDSCNSIGTELAVYAVKSDKRIAQLPIKTRQRTDAPRFGGRYSANKRILRALFMVLFHRPALCR